MANTPGNSGFSVLDMAQEMASAQETSIHEMFKTHPVSGKVKEEDAATVPPATTEPVPVAETPETPKPVKKAWTPSAEAMADLPELQQKPTTYTKEELTAPAEGPLENIIDGTAKQAARDTMDELTRKESAIEDAKAALGIKHFKIPEGPWHVKIHNAAIDINYANTQKNLIAIFKEIIQTYPEWIFEWQPGWGPEGYNPNKVNTVQPGQMVEVPEGATIPGYDEVGQSKPDITTEVAPSAEDGPSEGDSVVIHIDKRNVNQVAWSEEEVEKIRKARTVELNITETADLEMSAIETVAPNAVDQLLAQYQRKTNDNVASLPASKYRATFTGLSYPEVLDLTNSNEMNTLDGERAKWTLAFRHIKNQSIGPWEEYRWYNHPETGRKVKIPLSAPTPVGIAEEDMHTVTAFDDFLMKTSFMDLEFILWKILCATAMDKELISIDCHAMYKGKTCNKSYDWIYNPNDLLMLSSVNPEVLEEMKVTGEATGEEIIKNFYTSPVMNNNLVKLAHSGFQLIFGHVSAFDYLDHVYSDIKVFESAEQNDPTLVSRGLNYTTLTSIKGVLLPKPDGEGWYRIEGSENIVKVLTDLDEVDWQTVSEVVRLMMEPYQFNFALRDIVCPQCGNRSSIPIDDMERLLFIVARSLSNVQVELKRT